MKQKLPPNTKIEVIAKRKSNLDEVYSKTTTIKEWYEMKKSKNFIYEAYEIGFSAYPNKKKI